jgi:hypothetical protein
LVVLRLGLRAGSIDDGTHEEKYHGPALPWLGTRQRPTICANGVQFSFNIIYRNSKDGQCLYHVFIAFIHLVVPPFVSGLGLRMLGGEMVGGGL